MIMFNPFKKTSFGLDISDYSIEVVSFGGSIHRPRLLAKGRTILEPGIVEQGRIKDEKKLAQVLKKLLARTKPRPITTPKAFFALSDSQVYTHIFDLPPHEKKERETLISEEAQRNIPFENKDLLFSYKILKESEKETEVLLVATSKQIAAEWQHFFQSLGLEIASFEIEPLAIFRGLFGKPPQEPICLVDIGAAKTNIALFNQGSLVHSYSVKIAGNTFTEAVAQVLKINLAQAEEKKITIGLSNPNSQLFPILVSILESLSKEIKAVINYFEEKNQKKVEKVFLAGGSSELKGIVDYFKTNLGLPVKILPKKQSHLEYIKAVGLALKGIAAAEFSQDPSISLTAIGKNRGLR